jgi:hypothetical protein
VRLAYEQGLLKGKSLNFFQQWALVYWIYLSRRIQVEDKNSELEQQTFNLVPERWVELYRDRLLGELGLPDEDGEIQLQEDDLDELDKFMAKLESKAKFSMTGAQTIKDFQPQQEWGSWT